jgi:uncharacterized membrane protein YeaQ/YmgE (transglycosylase-associated protein family)
MSTTNAGFIIELLVGLVAGWLAGKISLARGLGIGIDLLLGVVGAFVSSWLFLYAIHVSILTSWAGSSLWWLDVVLTSAVGAALLLFALRLVRRQEVKTPPPTSNGNVW